MSIFSLLSAILLSALLGSVDAFLVHRHPSSSSSSSSSMVVVNDAVLLLPRSTTRGSSSSSSSLLRMTVLTSKGKKIDLPEGTPLKTACEKLGVKPKYSCKMGDCGSCTVSVGGSRIKACVGKVPPMPRLKSLQEKGLEVK